MGAKAHSRLPARNTPISVICVANRGKRADRAEPSGVTGAYTNANSDTRLPTVTSDTFNPTAMSGRMPTMMNSLMPSMKLEAIRISTGRLKNRSFAMPHLPSTPGHQSIDVTNPRQHYAMRDTI